MPTRSLRAGPIALSRTIRLANVFAAASLVAACGGGGGGDSGSSDPFAGLTVPDAPSASATAKLPSGLPAGRAAHCAELVDTDYRFISPRRNSTLADMIGILEVDALQLEVNTPTGTTGWIPARRTCEFEDLGGSGQIVVSQSGVIVGSVDAAPVIAFPIQSFDVPQLAGQWTALGQLNKGSGFVNVAADIAIATTGAVARLEVCEGVASCAASTHPTSSVLTKNADGGFDLSLPGWGNARLFAYQAGASSTLPGEVMVVMVREDGSFLLMTRRRTRTLPTVTTDFQTNWNLIVSPAGVTSPLVETSVRIDDITTTPNTFTRTTRTPGLSDSRSETVTINEPHTGYQHRPRPSPTSYPEWTLMPMRGMGFSALAFIEDNRFMFSVAQPDIPSATVSLPSGLSKLAPVAGCNALKNTPYRMVTAVNDAPTLDGILGVVNFSNITSTGLRTNLDGTVTQWTAIGVSPCEFSAALNARMIVAKSGVLIMLTPYTTPSGTLSYRLNIGFPLSATSITLPELQGTWNALGFEVSTLTATGDYVGTYTTLTLDEGGSVTALQYCEQDDNCVVAPAPIDLSLRASATDSGFDFGPASGPVDRVYAYRAGGGELMAVRVSPNGAFSLLTHKRREVLPAVASTFTQRWNVIVEGDLRTKELLQSAVRVDSINAPNRSYVWSWQEGVMGPFTETWFLDRPRDGYQRRDADSSQGPVLPAARRLDLRGMGLQLSIEPLFSNYDIAVDRP